MSVLTVDIGNSHTVFGVHSNSGRPDASFRIQTDRNACPDELYVFVERSLARANLSFQDVTTVGLGTVVPELEHAWRKLFGDTARVVMGDHKAPWSFRIALPNPAQLGSDRMANAEGALRLGAPMIIVDAGTATTFDVVSRDARGPVYEGGMICPGVGISLKALTSQTSRLPSVSLSRNSRGDFPVVARDTESAIRGGVIRGFAAMVDGLVADICREQGFAKDIPVIATGGFSGYLKGLSSRVTHFESDLTLEGLYAIATR